MTRVVVVVLPQTPLADAWMTMEERRIRHLPVVSEGHLLGILSDRDILLVAKKRGGLVDVPPIPASDVMSPFPYVCQPETPVGDIARTMIDHKVDALPVLSEDNSLVGLVTSTDLLALLIELDDARPLPFDWELEEYPLPSSLSGF